MTLPLPPHIRVPIASGQCSDPWYSWFQDLQRATATTVDTSAIVSDIAGIATALGSPDGSVEGIPNQEAQAGTIQGQQSIRTYGQLPNSVVAMLDGDVASPGFTEYYGSSAAGVRGWHAVSGAMAQGAGLSLTIGADGVTTFALDDLADSATGTFKLITRDQYGRLSGTADGTTSDVPEGSNLYYTDVRADARIMAQKGQPNGLATLGADSKLDAGQLPALAITDTFVVADEAAMLALVCEQGDVAVRSDLSTSFILTAEPASVLANWQELLSPTAGAVTSFNGRTGSVTPAAGDYTAAQVGADPAGTAAAIVAASITPGDTTHAPSGDAVFDALAGKQDAISDTGWQAMSLQNSWINYGSTYATPAYRKIGKVVYLRGLIKDGAITNGTVIAALAAGYRPPADEQVNVTSASSLTTARVIIRTSGNIQIYDVDSSSNISLSSVFFFVD